jgi:nitroreductase
MAATLKAETFDPTTPAERALRERYGADEAAAGPIAWNETLETLLAHRSVRAYLPDPLEDGVIETLAAAAQSASSSSNLQVWSVVAVQDPARKARLAELAGSQKHIVEAPLLLVWLIDFDRLTQMAKTTGSPTKALGYTETFLLGAVDAALAAQSAVVALESMGLGSCYIGGIRNEPLDVAAELNLPPRVFPLFGLVVGKPDRARFASVKPRLPQASVLFHETYAWTPAQEAALEQYDARMRAFQRQHGMAEKDWTLQSGERTRGPQAMSGRHVLKDVLNELGFDLR